MPLVRHFRLAAAFAGAALLVACSSPGSPGSPGLPAGGITDTTSATTAAAVPNNGPGFLTPTPPNGGGGVPVTPPPGGIAATATPTSGISSVSSTTTTRVASTTAHSASPTTSATPVPYQTPTPAATDTPVPVSSGAGANSIQVEMPSLAAVKPNGVATVQASSTVPGAICTLTVRYRTGGSAIPQFAALTADANGAVSWSWQVAPDVVPGDWPVTVRCQIGLPLDDANLPFAFATNLLPIR